MAYEGHVDELKAVWGGGEKEKETETGAKPINSAQEFMAAFGSKGKKK